MEPKSGTHLLGTRDTFTSMGIRIPGLLVLKLGPGEMKQ